jgi:putative hydrolase of the HAD superfamily
MQAETPAPRAFLAATATAPAANPPAPSPSLVLFDAAGTLLETAEPVENVYHRVFARHGIPAEPSRLRLAFRQAFAHLPGPNFAGHPDADNGDEAEREWWRMVVGRTAAAATAANPDAADHPPAANVASCFDELFAHYARGDAWRPFAEATAVVDRLKHRGHRLAVVSNFDRRLHRVLAELDLANRFDLILTSADVGSRKPSPDLLWRAADHFGLPPAAACLVGDSAHDDGGAAAAAGMPAFILDRPRTSLLDFEQWLREDFLGK